MTDTQTNLNFEDTYQEVVHEFTDAKELVRQCLKEDFRCRNDDLWLQLKAWEKQGVIMLIDYARLKELFTNETIRRVRQEIQNKEQQYLPTDPNVLTKRKFREMAIREFYGAKSDIYREFQIRKYGVK